MSEKCEACEYFGGGCQKHPRRVGEFNKLPLAVTKKQDMDAGMPSEAAARKAVPIYSGVLAYFPDALVEVARVSRAGNDQHNPGQPLHWAKEKSTDEADALVRHLLERGKRDSDGMRHSAKVAWRALALLQRELEADK
jgi:hypothetical protein